MDATDSVWDEYDGAARWCAQRGLKGKVGDPLPEMISREAVVMIESDLEAFQERIRGHAYAISMDKFYGSDQ